MDVRFVIVSPPRKRGALGVKLPILIGRAEEAKFRIQQDSVSRRHCEVFTKDGGVYVRDLGSTNGTFLDGEQVTAAVASFVRPGGEIRIGGVVFRVDYVPATAATVPDDDTASLDTVPMEEGEPMEGPPPAGAPGPSDAEPVEDAPPPFGLPAAEDLPAAAAESSDAEPAAGADDDNLTDFFKSLK